MYELTPRLIKILLIATLVINLGLNVFSQSLKLDSLSNRQSDPMVRRFDELIDVMQQQYADQRYDDALITCRKATVIAYQLGDSSKIVRCGRNEGQLLNTLDRSKEASVILAKVLPVAKRNNIKDEYKSILNNLALSYTFQAKYDEALKINFEALVAREEDKNVQEIVVSLNNIGLVYFKLKNYNNALEFYKRALLLRSESVQIPDVERLLINIGLCYNQLKKFDEAEKYFHEAFKTCTNNCAPQIKVEGNFGLGIAKFQLEDYDHALFFFQESLSISREISNQRFQAENLIFIARLFIHHNEMEKAILSLRECEQIAKNEFYGQLLMEGYKEYYNIYDILGEHENASLYRGKYIQLKDSIFSEQLIENLGKIQTNYAERENIKTIASKEVVIRQQRDLNIAVAIIAILAGLLILVLQRSNRVSKQVNAQLSEAKGVIQEQNKLLELKNKDLDKQVEKKTVDLERVNLSLKQVNEELDNFIYKTSHDIRGPLASLKGMCNVAIMDVQDPVALDYLRKLDLTAERLNSILTRLLIINQINNSKLSVSKIDFHRIIDEVLVLEKKRGLPPKLKITKTIDPSVCVQSDKELVRIVLENLIDNAIKFYNESDTVVPFVNIYITQDSANFVRVRVIDNGIGISESNPGKLFQMFFRASERSEIGGIGLYIVKTATAKIGGKVGLLTTPEGHTEFYVLFPLLPPTGEEVAERNQFA